MRASSGLRGELFGGSLIGMGVLSLTRHNASVGGLRMLTLYLQENRGWPAGLTQMMFDVVIIRTALPIVGWEKAAYSMLSAAALNAVTLACHRLGRYAAH